MPDHRVALLLEFRHRLHSVLHGLGATLLGLSLTLAGSATPPDDPYQPRNTQPGDAEPPSPIEALHRLALPEGFEATLFAHEPAVRQPIAMTWDDRGRLWVAESYSYEEWERRGEDRILILEDVDGDGRHDRRTVFWERGNHFAGIALGFGGVWVADAPNLIFIPDRDRDDQPDGEPEIVLTGWTTEGQHNMVNGLSWGPDGWLYGRHGVLQDSHVGVPGSPDSARVEVSCGIWRYHPQTRAFERVTRGSTNSWGLDWNAAGEMFMSGNVNGHLWHVIPGAYPERMHPTTKTPYVYERLTMSADLPHYLGTANWRRDWNRGALGRDGESALGGGHSHCGAMIYLGHQWPDFYRGLMFMCNTHGRRVNIDRLERRGASFVGTYEGDFLRANQSWFRGVSLNYGPDGAVYLSDWTDDGECHDHDGVHRTSGRIYRITHGTASPWKGDLARERDAVLLGLLNHPNHWFARHGRRILHERAVEGRLDVSTTDALHSRLRSAQDIRQRLESLWALHATGGLTKTQCSAMLGDPEPAVRSWAVRLLVDHEGTLSAKFRQDLKDLEVLARSESASQVRLALASVAQRIPIAERESLLLALAKREENHRDAVVQRMLWYAFEPVIANRPGLARTAVPIFSRRLTRLTGRRLMEPELAAAGGEDALVALLTQMENAEILESLLEGALVSASKPRLEIPNRLDRWHPVIEALRVHEDARVRQPAMKLAVALRHEPTLASLIAVVRDAEQPLENRQSALLPLPSLPGHAGIDQLCELLLHEGPAAILPSLPSRNVPGWSHWLLERWETLDDRTRTAAIEALSSRIDTAHSLLEALRRGQVSRREIIATQAQRIAAIKDDRLADLLETHWGQVQRSSREKQASIERYRALIQSSERAPDVLRGRQLYERTCGACHRLFGQGGQLGPDLTGSDRSNLDYLLQNIVDPGASVAVDYRLTVATTKDGRVISGSLVESDRSGVVLRTPTGEERLQRADLANRRTLKTSLMPEGLLQSLSEAEVIDLIAFLRTRASTH